jgi:hypothetical protein
MIWQRFADFEQACFLTAVASVENEDLHGFTTEERQNGSFVHARASGRVIYWAIADQTVACTIRSYRKGRIFRNTRFF